MYPISRSPNTLSDVENLIDKIIDSKQKIPPSVEKFKSTQDSEVNRFINPPYHPLTKVCRFLSRNNCFQIP